MASIKFPVALRVDEAEQLWARLAQALPAKVHYTSTKSATFLPLIRGIESTGGGGIVHGHLHYEGREYSFDCYPNHTAGVTDLPVDTLELAYDVPADLVSKVQVLTEEFFNRRVPTSTRPSIIGGMKR